jgi:ferrous iron transport protein A
MSNNKDWEDSSDPIRTGNWQGFTFFCNGFDPDKTQSQEPGAIDDDVFPLSDTQIGDVLCIIQLQLKSSVKYLLKIGIFPGAELQVVSRSNTGSIIVTLQGKSVGLGADMAASILVRKFD